jgi:hypothetical protein
LIYGFFSGGSNEEKLEKTLAEILAEILDEMSNTDVAIQRTMCNTLCPLVGRGCEAEVRG